MSRVSSRTEIHNKSSKHPKYNLIGCDNSIRIGNNCKFGKRTFIRIRGNRNQVIIEDECKCGPGFNIWIDGNDIVVKIGKGSTFTNMCQLCAQEDHSRIDVGEDCQFASRIVVRTSDSHKIYDIKTGDRINSPQSVTIGEHVWIGQDVTIMKGSIIGKGAVVGARSVVTKTIPENVIAVGQPAKVSRTNIEWKRS